jgi:DNA-binding transcriptional MocR family regulator
LWCRLPEWIDQRQLMAESARRHVSFLPGSICYAGEPAQNAIRLSFTTLPRELIREGVGRLMAALRACQPASRSDGAALEALDTVALL